MFPSLKSFGVSNWFLEDFVLIFPFFHHLSTSAAEVNIPTVINIEKSVFGVLVFIKCCMLGTKVLVSSDQSTICFINCI